MVFFELFHSLLLLLTFGISFLVYSTENPVHSILLLILTFFNVSIILFFFKCEFLALLFIIVYVGAIAILFLFVVMMLNVKVFKSKDFSYFLSSYLFFIFLSYILNKFLGFCFYNSTILTELLYLIDFDYNSLFFLGQVLFNFFLYDFIAVGLVLLVALVGAIVLVFSFASTKRSILAYKQLSRTVTIKIYNCTKLN